MRGSLFTNLHFPPASAAGGALESQNGMMRRHFLTAVAGAIAAACGVQTATQSVATSASTTAAPASATPSARPSPAATTAAPPTPSAASCTKDAAGHIQFIDTHAHLDAHTGGASFNFDGAADVSLSADDGASAKVEIVMPQPYPSSDPSQGAYDYTQFQPAVAKRRGRIAFLGGGGTLNPMIQDAIKAGSVSAEAQARFQGQAQQIIAAGGAGFGEMAAEHLSANAKHPYLSAPPDHPLFLALADIAAASNVPIDLHMVALTQDQPMFPQFLQISPNNPRTLNENISKFDRLLARNANARIVWAHAGESFVGCGDASLAQRLLAAHANLYLQLKPVTGGMGQTLVDPSGRISASWLALIRAFPDRLVLGGDNFWEAPGAQVAFQRPGNNLASFRAFVDQLPADIACKVASENATRVYRLS